MTRALVVVAAVVLASPVLVMGGYFAVLFGDALVQWIKAQS